MRAKSASIEFLDEGTPISMSIFERTESEELVILRDEKGIGKDKIKTDIDYVDTPEIVVMRDLLHAYNDHLSNAEISIDLTDAEIIKHNVNLGDRTVQRIFNRVLFDLGGRFSGGWWQRIDKDYRQRIYINDNPTVEYDYGSINVHLAYSLIGENYHALYGPLDGPYSVPGFSDYSRDILKKALLISLSAARKLSAKRAIRAQWRKDFEKYQYEGMDWN